MIKTKKQLIKAIEDAGEQWRDLALTNKEMRDQVKRAAKQYKEFNKRNKNHEDHA